MADAPLPVDLKGQRIGIIHGFHYSINAVEEKIAGVLLDHAKEKYPVGCVVSLFDDNVYTYRVDDHFILRKTMQLVIVLDNNKGVYLEDIKGLAN